MFGFLRRDRRDDVIDRFHAAIVEASRAPALYGPGGVPDTVEGRFESLALHVLIVLRRLRELPAPASEVAQDLVDSVFAHLEIALREMGVGDFGVPKRMKKLGQAFYDRTSKYEASLVARDAEGLAGELAVRLGLSPPDVARFARYCLAAERGLAGLALDALVAGPPFPAADASSEPAEPAA